MQASVNGIDIDYEVRGRGSPILLIHGWSADRHYMVADLEPVFEEHPGWQRIYLDLPGHGRTPAPPWLSTQAQMVEIVQRFVEAVVTDGMLAVAGTLTSSVPNRPASGSREKAVGAARSPDQPGGRVAAANKSSP